jgi:hypothetical protein
MQHPERGNVDAAVARCGHKLTGVQLRVPPIPDAFHTYRAGDAEYVGVLDVGTRCQPWPASYEYHRGKAETAEARLMSGM